MTDTQDILSMKEITKSFPGVVALENVSFSLKKGEIHALLGENGAGKSTLIKVLTGVEHPDAGSIELDGKIHEYQKEYDSERDSKLLNKGILVVRIQNDDVNDTSAIHEIIRKFVTQRRTQIAKDSSPSLIV